MYGQFTLNASFEFALLIKTFSSRKTISQADELKKKFRPRQIGGNGNFKEHEPQRVESHGRYTYEEVPLITSKKIYVKDPEDRYLISIEKKLEAFFLKFKTSVN